jgi:3D (Asp-Asp-Asp) domain-containing protein
MFSSWMTVLLTVYPERTIPSTNIRADLLKKNRQSETITLKATDIPLGGSVELSMDGIREDEYGNLIIDDSAHREEDPENKLGLYLNMDDGALEHIGGKEIKIQVSYLMDEENGYDLLAGTNSKVEAWLEGSVLHLKYTYDMPNRAIILPEWNFIGYGRGGGDFGGEVKIAGTGEDGP